MARRALMWLLPASLLLGGCKPTAHFLWVIWPGARERKVKAEFADLPGKTVAVVVYCDKAVRYEYPQVQLTVSSRVAAELGEHVKKVQVIDPRRVVRYQDEKLYWDEMDKTELGKVFGADYVLYVALVRFSTRERGALHLYHGHLEAQAGLYQTSLPERRARVWSAARIRVKYPKEGSIGLPGESDRKVRDEIERAFADRLAKRFYDHKVPIE